MENPSMPDTEDIKKDLSELIKLDIDASYAYSQAIEKIEESDIRESLSAYRDDHLRHVENLGAELRKIGGEVPEYKKDFKGFLIEGFTSLMSITGTSGALRAMQSNEKLTNRAYDKASKREHPLEIHELIIKNYEDEKRHLEYVNSRLEENI